MFKSFYAPWKISNQISRLAIYPIIRFVFLLNGIPWGFGWKFYGLPIIQKYRRSEMQFGAGLNLRSSARSNPLGPNHPVILCTWEAGATLEIGDYFAMTGGSICAAQKIVIGKNVAVGANSTIVDTDFHPLNSEFRHLHPQEGNAAPVHIEDNVFIGMNCLILKGVTIGYGSVIGAGSVVTRDVPPCSIVAGNPARVIRQVEL